MLKTLAHKKRLRCINKVEYIQILCDEHFREQKFLATLSI